MIMSWVTMAEPVSNLVFYWREKFNLKSEDEASVVTYKYCNYGSCHILHCNIRHLEVGFSIIFFFFVLLAPILVMLYISCDGLSV